MNKFLIIFTIIFSLILINNVYATEEYTASNATSFFGISIVDSENIYLTCVQSSCESMFGASGQRVAIVKFNDVTNNFTRIDNLTTGGSIKSIGSTDGIIAHQFYRGVQIFGSTGYFIRPIIYRTSSTDSSRLSIELYSFNGGSNTWGFLSNNTIAYANNSGATFTTHHTDSVAPYVMNALSNGLYSNNTIIGVFQTGALSNIYNGIWGYSSGYKLNANMYQINFTNNRTFNETIFYNINPSSSALSLSTFTTTGYYAPNTFSRIGNFNTGITNRYFQMKYGIIDVPNDYYYATDGASIYKGSVNDSINGITATNLNYIESCAPFLNQTGEYINSLSCKSESDCLFVGVIGTTGVVLSYDGNTCTYQNTNLLSDYGIDLTNNELYDVQYSSSNDAYYIVGSLTFIKYNPPSLDSFNIGGNTFSSKQCVVSANQDYLCNNSYYDITTNSFLCDIDSIIPCDAGCISILSDTTNSKTYYTSLIKTCSSIKHNTPFGLFKVNCDVFWSVNKLFGTSSQLLTACYGSGANLLETQCLDDSYSQESGISPFITYPNSTWSTQGQCLDTTCTNECTQENFTTCASYSTIQRCIRYDDGCLHQNITLSCGVGYTCRSGSCFDIKLVLNNFTDLPPEQENEVNNGGLSCKNIPITTRYLIVLFSVLAIFGSFVVVGFSTNTIKSSTILGIVVSSFAFVFFAIIGCIPVWVIIMLIIIAVAGAILIGKSAQSSGGV
jgi:hypothetical protein